MRVAFLAAVLAAAPGFARGAASSDPLESVVGVRANRGFQGLFEWASGADGIAPDKALGGPWITNGVILDLPGIARDLSIRPTLATGPRDVYVLTNLRSVHNARSIWVRRAYTGEGPIPAVQEVPAEIVALDGAVNLALLHAREPDRAAAPRGVRLASFDVTSPGREVLQAYVWEWRTYAFPDTIWRVGLNDAGGDPFWMASLPAYSLIQSIFVNRAGDPLFDPKRGALVGLVAHGLRNARDRGRDSWRGPAYAIPAGRIRAFLADALQGRAPVHGSVGESSPMLLGIGPELSRLLGLDEPMGFLVTADWNASGTTRLHEGDVVLRAQGRRLGAGGTTLEEIAFETPPGRSLAIEGLRAGTSFRVEVPVTTLPGRTSEAVRHTTFAGAWFQDLASVFIDPRDEDDGVMIAFVEDGSPAQAAGLDFRAVVKEVFGGGLFRPVHRVADFEGAIREIVASPEFTGELGVRVVDLKYPNVGVEADVIRMDRDAARAQAKVLGTEEAP